MYDGDMPFLPKKPMQTLSDKPDTNWQKQPVHCNMPGIFVWQSGHVRSLFLYRSLYNIILEKTESAKNSQVIQSVS